MLARLHEDFGGSKIVSINSNGDSFEMVPDHGDGLTGTFNPGYEKTNP